MEHNTQNSEQNHSHQHSHHTHHCCNEPRGADRCHEPSRQNNPGKLKKQSQKTTAIALGVLMLVSVGLITFEVVSNRLPEISNQTVKGSKSLLILLEERENEGAGLIASLAPTTRERQTGNQEGLLEANRMQSNKVRALQRQLVEANQKLHEVKAHLFTKGDPSDRARLAEICQDLVEKERQNHEAQERLASLESDKEQNLHKIRRMEQTIDALASMTDSQRETKEQAVLAFQAQIETLQNSAKEERRQLENTLAEVEENQNALKESLAKTQDVIKNLESEVTWQYTVIQDKDNEMQRQARLYTGSETELKKQLQDVIAATELEILKNHNLRSELEVAQAKVNAQHLYSKTMEDRVALAQNKHLDLQSTHRDNQIALAKQYLDLNGLLDVYANSHNNSSTKQSKLAALVREEKERANHLQVELEKIIAKADAEQQKGFCMEEELHQTVHNLSLVKSELAAQQSMLERKQQELETAYYTNASIKDQLQEKIAQMTASLSEEQKTVEERNNAIRDLTIGLELERTRSQELEHNLQTALAANLQNSVRGDVLAEELYQKSETLAALEERLQDKQNEIEHLRDKFADASSNFRDEQSRSQELHRALVSALEGHETDQYQIKKLSETLNQNIDTLALIQDRMRDKKNTIDDLQASMQEISDELAMEKLRSDDLHNALAVASAEKESIRGHSNRLESDINAHSKKIITLEDNIADKQKEVRTLIQQVHQLSSAMQKESARSNDLQEQLERTIAQHETQFQRTKNLEYTISQNENEINRLRDQLGDIATNFDSEKNRSNNLEGNLLSTLSRLNEKEESLNDVQSQHQVTSQEYQQLQAQMERLKKETNTLSNKARSQELIIKHQQDLLHQRIRAATSQPAETADNGNDQEDEEDMYVEAPETEELNNAELIDTVHKVTSGESLTSISVYYYGNPDRWIDIYNVNRKVITDKDHLQPGINIVIPR